ncbi:hypothetical protein J6590_003177 [Homalodisca vitripennis]|nr:hypothetical protein J6590_003177 [Homalodisca vitripennis]
MRRESVSQQSGYRSQAPFPPDRALAKSRDKWPGVGENGRAKRERVPAFNWGRRICGETPCFVNWLNQIKRDRRVRKWQETKTVS